MLHKQRVSHNRSTVSIKDFSYLAFKQKTQGMFGGNVTRQFVMYIKASHTPHRTKNNLHTYIAYHSLNRL